MSKFKKILSKQGMNKHIYYESLLKEIIITINAN